MSRRKLIFISFLSIVIYYLISWIIFGFFYESNDDPAFENMFRGVYWNTPVSNFYFYYRGIAFIFVWLYKYFDIGINWYGISLILAGAFACVFLNVILYFRTKSVLVGMLFLMVFLQNVFLVSFTRIAIFLSFTGLILIIYEDFHKNRKSLIILGTLLYLWAFLMRPNAGILGFLLVIPFILIETGISKILVRKIIYAIIPLIAGLFINFLIGTFQDKEFTRGVQEASTYTFPIIDYKYPFEPKDPENKIVAYELQHWFFLDKKTITKKNVQDLIDIKKAAIPGLHSLSVRIKDLISQIIHKPLFLFIFLGFAGVYIQKKSFSFKDWFLILYYLFLITGISIFMKMPYRLLIPVLNILIFYLIFTNFKNIELLFKSRPALKKLTFVLLPLVFIFQVFLYYQKVIIRDTHSIYQFLDLSDCMKEKKVVLITVPFNYNPLVNIKYPKEPVLIPAFGWCAHNKAGYDYLEKLCSGYDIRTILSCLGEKKDILFLSDIANNEIMLNILAFYQIKGEFIPADCPVKNEIFQLYVFKRTL